MAERFAGVDLKLKRAEGHLRSLTVEIRRVEARPYRMTSQLESYGSNYRSWVFYAGEISDPPEVWSALIGDVVQNLRNSLDHIVYALVPTGQETHRTAFPIYDRRHAFFYGHTNKPKRLPLPKLGSLSPPTVLGGKPYSPKPGSGMYAIKGLPLPTQSIVESFQPYHRRQPRYLRLLREMSNWDKHRRLLVAGYAQLPATLIMTADRADITVQPPKLRHSGRLKTGVEVASVGFRGEGDFEAHVYRDFPVEVRFYAAPVPPGTAVLQTLWSTLRFVRDTVVPEIKRST